MYKTKKNILRLFFIFNLVLLLSGCFGIKEIPENKKNYIGTWRGEFIVLTITPDAHVEYRYKKGNVSKSISGPISGFEGDDFKVGIFGLNTIFKVKTIPFYEKGEWKMVVDDQLVTRKDDSVI